MISEEEEVLMKGKGDFRLVIVQDSINRVFTKRELREEVRIMVTGKVSTII